MSSFSFPVFNPRKRTRSTTFPTNYTTTATTLSQKAKNMLSSELKKKKKFYVKDRIKKTSMSKAKLRQIMTPEVKIRETYQTWKLDSVTTYNVLPINVPTQGTSTKNRIGGKIQVIGLRVRGSTATPNTQTNPGCLRVRVALVRYKNVNQQTAYPLNQLFDMTTVDFTQANIYQHLKKDIKVIRDVVHEHDLVVGELYNIDWYVKLNDLMTLGDSSNGLFSDSSDYGYALYIGPGANSTSLQDGYQWTMGVQLTYIDV